MVFVAVVSVSIEGDLLKWTAILRRIYTCRSQQKADSDGCAYFVQVRSVLTTKTIEIIQI